jgi:hypothetical protein
MIHVPNLINRFCAARTHVEPCASESSHQEFLQAAMASSDMCFYHKEIAEWDPSRSFQWVGNGVET